jgi:hypothetical protein
MGPPSSVLSRVISVFSSTTSAVDWNAGATLAAAAMRAGLIDEGTPGAEAAAKGSRT